MLTTYVHRPSDVVAGRPLVALDRDGTLIEWVPYLRDRSAVQLLPGAVESVRSLVAGGCTVVVLTNQSVVARGELSIGGLSEITELTHLLINRSGVGVSATYACPHGPETDCSCRKPKIGMLSAALQDWQADADRTWCVGDNPSDMLLAMNAGVKGIRVMTGVQDPDLPNRDYVVAPSIGEASQVILSSLGKV